MHRIAVVVVAAVGLALAGCGGDETGTPAEQAFLRAMVPHHQSALDMAAVAAREADSAELRRLAVAIERSQRAEIRRMQEMHQRLFATPLAPDPGAAGALGLSAREAGMEHMHAADALRRASPFDPAFVEAMVPHHQGAVAMAQAVLRDAEDDEVRTLAEAIVADQTREIAAMRRLPGA